MAWRRRSSIKGCLPLTVGLLIGVLISYGIRLLSSHSFICRQRLLTPAGEYLKISEASTSTQYPPDQVVNLAFQNQQSGHSQKIQSDPRDEKTKATLVQDIINRNNHTANNICSEEAEECTIYGSKMSKQRRLLFVGVMTAHSYLKTRAKAVWNTWAKEIPGKVVFFTGGNSFTTSDGDRDDIGESIKDEGLEKLYLNQSHIPLVLLPGVDDSYPPQKKSFMMLKFMYEHYGNDFEWFMRADDDVYVRSDKLAEFLRSIDSRHLYFIGQAGKGNQVEKGTLNLAHNENFCMGGPGIILSRPTLAKVAPRVQECLKDMYSSHEDVEVGRCVQRFAGISCTWAYEMQTVFHHNSSGDLAFTGKLKRREVHKAITLHPIKSHHHLYRLHAYFKSLEIQALLYEKILIHRDLKALELHRTNNHSLRRAPVGSTGSNNLLLQAEQDKGFHYLNITGFSTGLNMFQPKAKNQALEWEFVEKGIYSTLTLSPKQKNTGDGREALEDVVRELMDIINGYSRARGRVIDFKEILYGYRRINPLHGVDYVLDLFMTYKKYRGRKMTIPVRRHVYIQRPFGPLQIRSIRLSDNANGITYGTTASLETDEPSSHSIPEEFINGNQSPATYPRKPTKMVMIVPLSGRFGTFRRFLDSFSEACLEINNVRKRWRVNRKDKVTFKMSDREKEGNDNMDTASSEEISFHPSLIVVFFGTDLEKEKFLQLVKSKREILATLLGNKSSSELQCNIQMVQIDGAFSRGIALETGISQCHENDLLVLIDVDLIFTAHGLRRAHLNTKQNHQVYFPVIFSQYNPDFYEADKSSKSSKSPAENAAGMGMESFLVGNKSSADKLSSQFGYWRDFGYGIAAFYKSDFRSAGGFDTSIKGWGKEDVALFDRFVHHTNLTIFRAPDPDLVHVFHPIECDKSLSHSQYEMCIGSQASTLGSTENLMKHIFYNRGKYTRFQHLFDR